MEGGAVRVTLSTSRTLKDHVASGAEDVVCVEVDELVGRDLISANCTGGDAVKLG
jgi:hypothetical protein